MERRSGFIGAMFAVLLAVLSLQADAAQQIGRDFNHMTTGFTLTGGHAAAACETCHVGGVFKGTPRNCDGCHAVGQRVVATPKNDKHIVTDAPCESCHFNTATWLGARYNHGSAVPGQCRSCHNGRQASAKAPSHSTGSKATKSCDSCHRTFAWFPASWNHVGVAPGSCVTCHDGATAIGKSASHTTVAKATYACDECHSFVGWTPARYKHNTAAACSSCHNTTVAVGKPVSHGAATIKGQNECSDCHTNVAWLPGTYKHTSAAACSSCHDGVKAVGKSSGHIATTAECNQCHTTTTTWLGALGAKPAKHIPYANASEPCTSCHIGTSVKRGTALHVPYLAGIACYTCHGSNTAYSGQGQKTERWPNFHESSKNPSATDCSSSNCHKPGSNGKGALYSVWD
ncbi:MAG: hypothetical protein KJ850_10650 [Gammaproteobacteria bacterium]|nr:hypothetical protein [Gammaproteobacteria bacterium]MBU1625488.1 hypothetical protein [Gammaproteobacteria bacterium]MBU1980748.1 hypothetical protein [Gammaproteobacteria bacterium]